MNHYPDSRNGGIENVTRMLSEHFYHNGYTVDVVYLFHSENDHSDDSIFGLVQYMHEGNIVSQIKEWCVRRKIDVIINRSVIFATPLLREATEDIRCKIITTYNNKPTLIPPTLKEVWMNKNTPLWKKITVSLLYSKFRKNSVRKLRERHQMSYQNADTTVLLSHRYVREYCELMHISVDNIVVMNNPIRDELRISAEELSVKKKYVLMITRLDETQKCIIKALDIWNNVVEKHYDWELKIIGNGPDKEKIIKYAKRQGIKNVVFLPACNPLHLYRESSIFLMTSRNEGWPNTINEAMRMGCVPVVLGTFSAIYDMVDSGIDGEIIEPGKNDSEKMAFALENLICDQTRREKMAISAINKSKRLSIDIISKKWIALLEEIIQS